MEPGNYIFETNAKGNKIVPFSDDKGEGAGIRISGSQTQRKNKVTSENRWQKLTYEFTLESAGEIELVCEMRASAGEVWFDIDLKNIRKKLFFRKKSSAIPIAKKIIVICFEIPAKLNLRNP